MPLCHLALRSSPSCNIVLLLHGGRRLMGSSWVTSTETEADVALDGALPRGVVRSVVLFPQARGQRVACEA